jgi:hypothetical protein
MLSEKYRETVLNLLTDQGLEPPVIADKVFDAVRNDQLYIFTHADFAPAITGRTKNIVEQRNPDLSIALRGFGPKSEATG